MTVGSTSFPLLIDAVLDETLQQMLVGAGYTHLTVQTGSTGSCTVHKSVDELKNQISRNGLVVTTFAYKDSIHEDISRAHVVLAHGGAATILEALDQNKPLIVCANPQLMDNHQQELCDALAVHLTCTTVDALGTALVAAKSRVMPVILPANDIIVPRVLDSLLNVQCSFHCGSSQLYFNTQFFDL